ncbi:hypothetical protein KSS87_001803 [Heliosperma pusillum]|nr:hypothetical protein KSS87_001803 [Heliosperma pusillum]
MVSGTIFHCKKNSWPPEEYVSKIALQLVRLGIRLWSYVREEASYGRKAPIDPFSKEKTKPSASQGVPLGGMGSGSISRGFRGEFKHWQIIPGLCDASPVMADQFSIFISRDGGIKKYASVLAPGQHEGLRKSGDQGIYSWGWNLTGQHSSYHALFPRAWTIYDGEPDPELKISCRQISPFIPHNYRDSSLPTAVFVYTVVGKHWKGKGQSQPSLHLGCKTVKDNPPVTFSIAAIETQNVNVTVLPCFGLAEGSRITAKDMWTKMSQDGQFDRDNFDAGRSMPSLPGETLCAAVSASTWVEPHGKCTVAFSVAWSSPRVKFSKGSFYHRRYTKYFGTSQRSAEELAHYALTNYKRWEEDIEKWQDPVLKDDKLPEWYKFTLFNELYFLVAGGTVWIDSSLPVENSVSDKARLKTEENSKIIATPAKVDPNGLVVDHISGTYSSDVGAAVEDRGKGHAVTEETVETLNEHSLVRPQDDCDDVGRFLYLEGVEYIMWCTYDVHFYASFALLDLFPKIELSIQREFAKAVLSEDGRRVKFLAEGNSGIRKVRGAVPHDLGMHDPWHEMNAYNIHDTSKWKDLNPKFVLQVYRDFVATGDMSFGIDVWPSVRAAMEYMEQFDRDNDGLIENDGFPDQTYDTWTVHGVSAYCGCLWLAALQAGAAMAFQLGDREFGEKCKRKFLKAKSAFEAKLWNGSYFNYDSGSSSNSKSIQADQLAGQWYTASSGLPNLFDDHKIKSTLQKIFDYNVLKVKGGRMGAVNGMHPNGKIDETCMQSREIWTGVTYAVAATQILSGMREQGFTTAEGIFTAGWSEDGYGYWFQTPEAWTMDGHFRSLIYMRPLAIWGMQWALTMPRVVIEPPRISLMDRIDLSPFGSRSSRFDAGVRKAARRKPSCFGNSVFHCAC